LKLRLLVEHAFPTACRLFPASKPNRAARENRGRAVRSTTGTTPSRSDHAHFFEVTIRPGRRSRQRLYGRCRGDRTGKIRIYRPWNAVFSFRGNRREGESFPPALPANRREESRMKRNGLRRAVSAPDNQDRGSGSIARNRASGSCQPRSHQER
jgi:hypothetical protein